MAISPALFVFSTVLAFILLVAYIVDRLRYSSIPISGVLISLAILAGSVATIIQAAATFPGSA